jgi:3-oxoacyl-[acyl-carrier protein] reductase
MKRLDERVAVVTGAANGVGLGIARVLAAEGASVVVADVDGNAAEVAAEELRGAGGRASAVAVDVADRGAVDAMAARAIEQHGRIDILAANAGIYPNVLLAELTDDDWDRVMDINVKGAVHSIQACMPPMRERGYGRIVLTSSITGTAVAVPGLAHYAASKAALLGLMRVAALELAGDGITVNAVLPGNVDTPGFAEVPEDVVAAVFRAIPLNRLAQPEDVGWAVRYLASEEAAYVTGQTLVVDGGQLLPEIVT